MKNYNICDKAFEIASFAVKSMLYEVTAFPKPGLVTPVSCGAHKDMNYYTFLDSSCSLMKYMTLFVQHGFSNESERIIFQKARKLGMEAEKYMFDNTHKINTHKGMIFLMGISCVAVGKVIHEGKSFKDIKNVIQNMAKGVVKNELESIKNTNNENKTLTYGEKLYKKYGIAGIRGEVEKGIPIVFEYSLQCYEKNSDLSNNDRLVHTLIQIMQYCEDTNVLHRHSIEVLNEIQSKAKYIISLGGMRSEKGRQAVENLAKEFVERGISPGGVADILAVTVFFYLVKKHLNI
ncbi:triphosphoribosyl-dephospho-CoA synthase CitG [Haloimpatiens sp. FM7330]|uniref:triphosphoribosyl-dephospho-CoA synthase CitG n=1 Tax=Haloimpatiens sp. FM7330 TaxID=3298610 RepID=UPI0036378EC1